MKLSDIAAKVTTEHQAVLIREREREDVSTPREYDVKDIFEGKKRGWMIFDGFTASAVNAVFNAINDDNKEKFNRLHLSVALNFCWKQVK